MREIKPEKCYECKGGINTLYENKSIVTYSYFALLSGKWRNLKLKNNEAICDIDQAIEKARAELHKAIEMYGRGSDEVVIASQNLDTYINMSMKREV